MANEIVACLASRLFRSGEGGSLEAGSDRGAEHWTVVASLVETCKLNGVNPQAYFADVLQRLVAGHPQSRIDDLMPWAYPQA